MSAIGIEIPAIVPKSPNSMETSSRTSKLNTDGLIYPLRVNDTSNRYKNAVNRGLSINMINPINWEPSEASL